MDPISVVVGVVAVSQHLLNSLYRYDEVAEAKNLLLSIDISLLRLRKWQTHWFEGEYSSDRAKRLWGKEESAKVEETIKQINETLSELSVTLGNHEKKEIRHPGISDGVKPPEELTREVDKAFRDMDQRKRGHKRFVKFFKKSIDRSVQDTTRKLSLKVDELDQTSSLAYQIVYGLRYFENQDGVQKFVTHSIRTRQGALNLWDHCRCDKFQCSLGIDMRLNRGTVSPLHVAVQSSLDAALCFRLLWTMDDTYGFMKLADTLNGLESNEGRDREEQSFETPKSHIHDLTLQNTRDRSFVKVHSKYCEEPSRFEVTEIETNVPLPQVLTFSSTQKGEKYAKQSRTALFAALLDKDKVLLAYKVAECGVELLGTPWFARLAYTRLDRVWVQRDVSKMQELQASLQRTQEDISSHGKLYWREKSLFEKDFYTLDVPRVKIDDMMVQDSGMLAEHNQLSSLGLLLIRIALGNDVEPEPKSIEDRAEWASKTLPLVAQKLGNEYAEACKFCVGIPREGHWESYKCDKYSRTDDLGSWKNYLEHFIADFYSEVYLK